MVGDNLLAEIRYGDAAEIWRINLGWSRREKKEERGFWLDVEQRRWSKRAVDPDNEEDGDDLPGKIQRVIPYVKDRSNSLLLTLQIVEDPAAWARRARNALYLCHFDPESGSDLGKAEHAEENCQAACYDCLLSYYNQPAHPALH